MTRLSTFTTFALVTLLMCTSAIAGDVYLNGVKVNGLRDQNFEGADLRFDSRGDLHITVRGVSVEVQGQSPAGTAGAVQNQARSSYYLVSSKTTPGLTQYDIQVHINGQFVTKCRSGDRQLVMEVSRFLRPGQNQVVFTAFKDLATSRKSFAQDQRFGLILGKGMNRGDQIVIERTLASYERTAADVANDSVAVTVFVD